MKVFKSESDVFKRHILMFYVDPSTEKLQWPETHNIVLLLPAPPLPPPQL